MRLRGLDVMDEECSDDNEDSEEVVSGSQVALSLSLYSTECESTKFH